MRNKSIFFFLVLLFVSNKVSGQELKAPVPITAAEYFFDTDPGRGNGISIPVVSPEGSVTLENIEIDISVLSAGFHKLYVRVKDETNIWGAPRITHVYVPELKVVRQVTNAEIIIDTKKGFGSGIEIPINSGEIVESTFDLEIESNSITSGFHKAYVRLKDDSNQWGNYISSSFYVPANKPIRVIDKAEYFYDEIGETGTGTAINATGSAETGFVSISNVEIEAPSTGGFHRLIFRLGDDSGTWGMPNKHILYQPKVKEISTIVEAEYFINSKTAFGEGTVQSVEPLGGTYSGELEIPLSSFENGFSKVYLRLKDESGMWGNYVSALTYKNRALTEKAKITSAEYFLSSTTRPSAGNGFPLSDAIGNTSFDSVAFSAKALVTLTQSNTGTHAVYVRAEDTDGVWGVPTPVFIEFTNQRMIQGQLYKGESKTESNLISNGSVNILSGGEVLVTAQTDEYGVFTFQDKIAGEYELRYVGDTNYKQGTTISDTGESGLFTVGNETPQYVNKDIAISKPLHVIATSPTQFDTRMKSNASIELSFSGKFNPSTFTNSNVSLISDMRGKLTISISSQANDSVLIIKPTKSILPNEKITLYLNSTFLSPVGLSSKPFSTFFRGQVSNGGVTFAEPTQIYGAQSSATYVYNSYALDVDNDGDIDIVTFATYHQPSITDTLYVHFNNGSGVFTDVSKKSILTSLYSRFDGHTSFVGDYDRDGDIDFGVFLVDINNSNTIKPAEIHLFKNNGTGSFNFDSKVESASQNVPQYVDLIDANYDGFPELIVPSTSSASSKIYLNSAGEFNALSTNTAPTSAYRLNIVDVTGDGLLDVLPSTGLTSNEKLYVGSSNSISDYFTTERYISRGVNTTWHTYLIEDFSRDGKVDYVGFGTSSVGVYFEDLASSSEYFSEKTQFSFSSGSTYNGLAVGDIDNNGRVDVVNAQNGQVTAFSYTTNPNLTKFNYLSLLYSDGFSSSYRSPQLADFDKDGDLDLLLVSGNTSAILVRVIKNTSVSTNTAPVFTSTIPTKDLRLEEAPTEINISGQYSDSDGDGVTITATSSKSSVVTASFLNDKITLTPVAIGNATITLTLDDDKGGIATVEFIVYVNAPDNFTPRIANLISDVETRIADDSTTINLSNVFTDPDVADVLTYDVQNPNSTIAQTYITGSTLVIKPLEIGEISITVSASDSKASAETSFLVTVGPRENRAPTILASIPSQTFILGDPALQINPSTYFTDPDGDVLTYSVSASNPSIAGGSYNSSTNRILITGASAGTTNLTITATDTGGKTTQSSFLIFVNAKPRSVATIPNLFLVLGGQSASFSLQSIFTDDNTGQSLSYIVSSDNPAISSVSVSGITLSFFATGEGTTTATIKASDGISESAPMSVQITVKTQSFAAQSSNTTDSFYADGITVKNWCLISIPGTNINGKPTDLISPSLDGSSDFKLFMLLDSGEYADVTDESGSVFSPGNSFWFKTLALNEKFTLNSPAGNRITNRITSLNVNQWKFISNPYEVDATWSRSSSNVKLWKFLPNSQSWSAVPITEKLKPWTGYVAYSPSSALIAISLDNLTVNALSQLAQAPTQDEISLKARIQIGDNELILSDRNASNSEYDEFDEPLMPATPDQKIAPAYFKSDLTPLVVDSRSIKLNEIDAVLDYRTIVVPKGNSTLTWTDELASTDSDQVLALINESTYRILSPGETMKFAPNAKEQTFKVYVGKRELVEKHVLPESPQLFSNYPNPFNPTTSIRYALTKPGNVRLDVFDVLGRKVQTVINTNKQAGFYTEQFNGINLASGIYLYRLTIDNEVISVKKMTLIK